MFLHEETGYTEILQAGNLPQRLAKGYEFDLETRAESEPYTSQTIKSLAAISPEQSSHSNSVEELSNDAMSPFIKKFVKFMLKLNSKPNSFDSVKKNSNTSSDDKCYNYCRPGHFIANCRKPKKDEKKQLDCSSKDKKGEDILRSPAQGRSSSSESEDEVQCLMPDDTDEVFDFSNLQVTCEDLVTTLKDMVHEYKKLSQSFEEVKAERESHATKAELPEEEKSEESPTAVKPQSGKDDIAGWGILLLRSLKRVGLEESQANS
ncbi:hypothetical protein F511_39702 [Dorcoceras hygrometricum]|uniref:CCHC-type domain-containing protein n=1 Tax=Dorcoceras hygrometricum TaxID=472368 RepID=A0A2Z7BNA5_9LAMI|nr:hypothetical protein F511_39702 [Dorcoceras hygrometricum]